MTGLTTDVKRAIFFITLHFSKIGFIGQGQERSERQHSGHP
jgi:hypothetical protein